MLPTNSSYSMLGTWDTPPSTVIIGEESWGLGKDYWIAGQNFWQSTVKYTSPDEWRREGGYIILPRIHTQIGAIQDSLACKARRETLGQLLN